MTLNRLTVLAVALTIPPVLGEASDVQTNAASDVQNQSQRNKATTQNPSTQSKGAKDANSPNWDSQRQRQADTQQPITVCECAAVPVGKDWYDTLSLIFTGLLVLVGFLTFGVVAWQSWETREAAQAGRAGAEAALLNAQAVINSERPWIVVSVESPKPNEFHFWATNVGRTPAKVTAIYSRPAVITREQKLELYDGWDKEGGSFAYPPCLLPPTARCLAFKCKIEEYRGLYSAEEWMQRFEKNFSLVYSYGTIIYFDTLGVEPAIRHETEWLYLHLPGSLPFADPTYPEHNRYT
ncbi:MAG: hypothetical protein ABSB67_10075 [Bryobacteraceae bacterium]